MRVKKVYLQQIVLALFDAKEHLEYCGYGDHYERECAKEEELPKQIANALILGNKLLGELEYE
jgi:hypothetical protein